MLPYHKRPKCQKCEKRAATLNPRTGKYTEPCYTCQVADVIRDSIQVWRSGPAIKARIKGTDRVFEIARMGSHGAVEIGAEE